MPINNYSDEEVKNWMAGKSDAEVAAQAASLGLNAGQIQQAYQLAGKNYSTEDINKAGTGMGYNFNGANGAVQKTQQQAAPGGGVQEYSADKGVWSPMENRWIPKSEIQGYFAANPNMTADQAVAKAGELGLNPYTTNAAVWMGQGGQAFGTGSVDQQKFANAVSYGMDTGSSGYGAVRGGGNTAASATLAKGSGMHQYKMPDGSLVSVDVQNGRPTQTYEQALAGYRPGTAAIQQATATPYAGGSGSGLVATSMNQLQRPVRRTRTPLVRSKMNRPT